jgi:O-antigen/teichoic acid export membrane protein
MTSSRTGLVLLNAGTSLVRLALSMVVMFFLTALLIRTRGVEEYGLWALVNSLVGFLALMELGFSATAVKIVAECRGSGDVARRNAMASTLLIVNLGLAAVATVVVGALALVFNPLFDIAGDQRTLSILLLWLISARNVLLALPFDVFRGILFGEQKAYVINAVQVAANVLYGAAGYVALERGGSVLAVAVVGVSASVVEHLSYAVLAHLEVVGLQVGWRLASRSCLREMMSFSAWQVAVNVAGLILFRMDPVLVKLFLSMGAVGVYAVAQRIAECAVIAVKQLTNVLTPVISEYHGAADHEALKRLLLSGTRYALGAMTVLVVALGVHAEDAVRLWVGPEGAGAAPVLRVLMVAMLFHAPFLLANDVLFMTGRHRFAALAAVGGVVVNATASIALVGRYDLLGIAAGTVAATVLVDLGVVARRACVLNGIGLGEYLRGAILPALLPGLAQAAVSLALARLEPPESLPGLAARMLPGVAVYAMLFWRFFTGHDVKRQAARFLRAAGVSDALLGGDRPP